MVQIGDLLAQITGESSPTTTTHTIPPLPKRKPDEQLRKSVDKMQKTGVPAGGSSRQTTQQAKSPAVDSSMAKMKLGQNGGPSLQNPTTTFKNGQPTPPPQTEPAKPPKKGSYAEIIARGKAAQATLGQVGKIQHKRIEKLPSKREREEMKAVKSTKAQNLRKNLGPNGKFRTAGQALLKDRPKGGMGSERKLSNGKDGSEKKSAEAVAERKVKKAALATTGYTGTARPKPGAKAPSRQSMSASRYDRGPNKYRDDRYSSSSKRRSYPSEDEEDEEEDEEDYGSDASSDMEAAAFEVDEEEEEAARIARREDAEALAEENRHKREKEEKRRRLVAMAKARR
jgi:protein SPT2